MGYTRYPGLSGSLRGTEAAGVLWGSRRGAAGLKAVSSLCALRLQPLGTTLGGFTPQPLAHFQSPGSSPAGFTFEPRLGPRTPTNSVTQGSLFFFPFFSLLENKKLTQTRVP